MLRSELTVPDISAAEFFELEESEFLTYHGILTCIKPDFQIGKIRATSLVELTFRQVENIKLKASQGELSDMLQAMETVFSVEVKDLLNLKCYEFYKLYNWFTQSLRELIDREAKFFKEDNSDELWKTAAQGRFEKFGSYSTSIPLAEKFGKNPAEVMEMKYIDVFSAKLYYKELAEATREYEKLLKQKQKATKGA